MLQHVIRRNVQPRQEYAQYTSNGRKAETGERKMMIFKWEEASIVHSFGWGWV